MYFLLSRIDGNVISIVGLIIARTPGAAAKKMGMELQGGPLTHCWSVMPAHNLKPIYPDGSAYHLQKLKNLRSIPKKDKKHMRPSRPKT